MIWRMLAWRFLGLIAPKMDASARGVGAILCTAGFVVVPLDCEASCSLLDFKLIFEVVGAFSDDLGDGRSEEAEAALDVLRDRELKISSVSSRMLLVRCNRVGYAPGLSPVATAPEP